MCSKKDAVGQCFKSLGGADLADRVGPARGLFWTESARPQISEISSTAVGLIPVWQPMVEKRKRNRGSTKI